MTALGVLNVSRETIENLRAFESLVQKWTTKINLVSKSSTDDLWERHILDSAQLFQHVPESGHWVDLGSGGGFPGIVVAILSKGAAASHSFTFVESDQRKCAFLRTAARELGLAVTVKSERIEDMDSLQADILTARALTDLSGLLGFADQHLRPGGIALFPKGAQWEKEHEDAQRIWSYGCEVIKSETNTAAAVLKIQDIARV